MTTSTTSGWMSRLRPITLGSTKFSSSRLEASTTTSMIGGLGEPAVAEGDDHGQPAAEEGADVGDVAADEVDDHDGEHEREAEQQGGEADDHRHDGGHDGAALAVVAQDPAGIADEAVDVAAQRRVERARRRSAGSVLPSLSR